ncbi:MAG: hypothetical protein ACYC2E_12275 [Sulfuricella sp.]
MLKNSKTFILAGFGLAQLRKRATDSIKQAGRIDDRDALDHLLRQTEAGTTQYW